MQLMEYRQNRQLVGDQKDAIGASTQPFSASISLCAVVLSHILFRLFHAAPPSTVDMYNMNTSVVSGRSVGWSCGSTACSSQSVMAYVRPTTCTRTFHLAYAQGKDSVFLCSLNNFDGYYVTRPHKAPKPYVFAVKSTDSLTFFENTSDYVHLFSCTEGEGKNWLEKILLARVRSE